MTHNENFGFSTLELHAGQSPDPQTGSRAVPIYQTTSYQFRDSQHARDLFSLNEQGYIYTRIGNPTQQVLEERVTALEGGVGTLAVASGQAAVTYAILNLAESGDEIISTTHIYGGTFNLFKHTLPKFGITVKFVEPNDLEALEQLITDKTKAVFAESIGNPVGSILDIEGTAKVCHKNNLPLIVDNTFLTPYLCQPIQHGANVVVHSATKFIDGNGTSIGGLVVDGGNFDWSCGRFPEFVEPDPSYHGISYTEDVGAAAYITKMRAQLVRDLGACISPFNAFQLIQGLETLSLRMRRHVENAYEIARYLESHPKVSWVSYPGLGSHPDHELSQKYAPKGPGAVFTFGVSGGLEHGKTVIDSVKLFSHVANVGDAKSLIIHPASTTHSQLSEEDLRTSGVTPEFIRISIGLEEPEDLINDLDQALQKG